MLRYQIILYICWKYYKSYIYNSFLYVYFCIIAQKFFLNRENLLHKSQKYHIIYIGEYKLYNFIEYIWKAGDYMNTVITIGRQFGSAGREIGEKVAEYFGIKCYDKELLSRAAKESGFCEEMIQNHDERPTNSFLYNLVMDTYSFGYNASSFVDMPISHKVFLAQFDTIKKIADEGPCVIVGRCADYALSDYKNCVHLFIYGEEETKVKRIMEKYNLTEAKAKEMIVKKDKQRQSYYNYYSSKKWGRADSYDLCINSSVLGIEDTVRLIVQYIEDFEKHNNF